MKIIKIFSVLLFLQFSLNTALAQFDEPTEYLPFEVMPESNGTGPDPCDDPGVRSCKCPGWEELPECIPIDGGVVALLAAGVGYGIKRVRDNRRKEVEEVED